MSTKIIANESNPNDLAAEILRKWQYLFGLRGNWANHWTEIAERLLPMDSWLFQNYQMITSQGDKRNYELYDSTGLLALKSFAAILDSLLTPRDQFWHNIRPEDPALMKNRAVRLWFEDLNNTLFQYRYDTRANFQAQNQIQYQSLGAYGTGINFIDKLYRERGLRYKNIHLGEAYLEENHQGLIDTIFRRFMLTARQAYLMFGENLPDNIVEAKDKAPEEPFYFIHACYPNEYKDERRLDYKGMDFCSHYVAEQGPTLLKKADRSDYEGYRSFPYAVSRYYQATNEAYGRSIAMDVLPELKTLNEMYKVQLKQGHRAVDPVLLAHDDGIIDGFDLTPGAINPGGIDENGRLLVQPLPTGNIAIGEKEMAVHQEVIKDAFLVNLMQILTENPQQTATEVMERTREKAILMAPTIGRQNSEYLGPMIEREVEVLQSQGALPKMPAVLQSAFREGIGYKIDYDSPITRTQKSEWVAGAARSLQFFQEISNATQDPSIMDNFNLDVAAPAIARINGMPESWIQDQKVIQMKRQQRAQQAQQEQMVKAAPALASMAQATGQIKKGAVNQ